MRRNGGGTSPERHSLRPRPLAFPDSRRPVALTPFPARAKAKSKAANRRTQSLDREVNAKRAECESALRDEPTCTTSSIEMDNCVLRCVSGRCYEAVYGGDALEEGEIDVKRGRTFRSCARAELREAKQAEQARAKAEREENL